MRALLEMNLSKDFMKKTMNYDSLSVGDTFGLV